MFSNLWVLIFGSRADIKYLCPSLPSLESLLSLSEVSLIPSIITLYLQIFLIESLNRRCSVSLVTLAPPLRFGTTPLAAGRSSAGGTLDHSKLSNDFCHQLNGAIIISFCIYIMVAFVMLKALILFW